MLKTRLINTAVALCLFAGLLGPAAAQVDVNKATVAELDGLPGIGPAASKAILEERKKGNFKDWADLEARVKGVGERSAAKLSQAGLTVDGKSRPNTPAAARPAKAGNGGDGQAAKAGSGK
ncbi:MAG: ComEA family DNA-binding protein [Janthinobacterium lividum]